MASDSSTHPALEDREILIPTSCAVIIGFASGATTSGKLAGYQFMAENLHRLPKDRTQHYFFQKTKNYKVILGGFKGGLRTGGKLGAWTAGFCTLKEACAHLPPIDGRKSLAGALSGLAVALGASSFYRLRPLLSPPRLLLAAALGLCAGLAEDAKAQLDQDSPTT